MATARLGGFRIGAAGIVLALTVVIAATLSASSFADPALSTALPTGVTGTSAPEAGQAPVLPSSPNDASVVRELPDLRAANSDTYEQSDGSRLVKIYEHAINYSANGAWQPINDQLQQASDGSLHPIASPVPVSLPATLGAAPITVGPAGRQLSFSLQGAAARARAGARKSATQEHSRASASPTRSHPKACARR